MRARSLQFFLLLLAGCSNPTAHIPPVHSFDAARYTGTWYEIARLPNSFERGLDNIRADYSLDGKGGLRVVNSGRDEQSGRRREAQGRAHFTQTPDIAELKVTFFWPFYGLYKMIALDQAHYEYAMIISRGYDYLWILARHPRLEPEITAELVEKARGLGFPVDSLVWVPHNE